MVEAKPRSGNVGWRWAFGILTVVALWWMVGRSGEITSVERALSGARWQWLALAALVYAGSLSLSALNYRRALSAVGISARFREVLPTLLASLVLGEVTPFGWAAGSAVFLRFATRRGHSAARAAIGTLLAQASDLLAFSTLFLAGMIALLVDHHALSPPMKAGALFLLAMNVGLVGLLALAVGKPESVKRLTAFAGRFMAQAKVEKALSGLTSAGAAIRKEPRRVLFSLGAALGSNGASAICLLLVFQAFGQPVGFGQLVMGFGVGTLAWMASPIPAGVGVVEGALALAFASLGIAPTKAVVIAIVYRGISFWLPFLIGLFCLREPKLAPTPPFEIGKT